MSPGDMLAATAFAFFLFAVWRIGKRIGRLNPALSRGPRLPVLVIAESLLFIAYIYVVAYCRFVFVEIAAKDQPLGRALAMHERVLLFLGES